jgi:hypothetical protein
MTCSIQGEKQQIREGRSFCIDGSSMNTKRMGGDEIESKSSRASPSLHVRERPTVLVDLGKLHQPHCSIRIHLCTHSDV